MTAYSDFSITCQRTGASYRITTGRGGQAVLRRLDTKRPETDVFPSQFSAMASAGTTILCERLAREIAA